MKLKHPEYMNSAWRQAPDGMATHSYFSLLEKEATVTQNNTKVTFETSVSPDGAVVIAPHGVLTIQGSGERDPDWRYDIRCLLGVDFDLASEFSGMLFCPHTKQKVPVSRIVGTPVLWCDREHGVALESGQITYASPEAVPVRKNESLIHYSFINRKRVKEFMLRWKRLVNEAKVRMSMMGGMSAERFGILPLINGLAKDTTIGDIEALVRISQQILPASTDELTRTYQVCWTITANCERHDLKELISFACADQYQSPYLEYRP